MTRRKVHLEGVYQTIDKDEARDRFIEDKCLVDTPIKVQLLFVPLL